MPPITDISQLDPKKQYTYADYLTWQFSEPVELIKGWIYKMSPATASINIGVVMQMQPKPHSYSRHLSFRPLRLSLRVNSVEKSKNLNKSSPSSCRGTKHPIQPLQLVNQTS